jgi:hypothetical protein
MQGIRRVALKNTECNACDNIYGSTREGLLVQPVILGCGELFGFRPPNSSALTRLDLRQVTTSAKSVAIF